MSTLLNFSHFALNRNEMKAVRGGECGVWSIVDGKRAQSVPNMSLEKAKKEATRIAIQTGLRAGWCCKSCV